MYDVCAWALIQTLDRDQRSYTHNDYRIEAQLTLDRIIKYIIIVVGAWPWRGGEGELQEGYKFVVGV